MRKIIGFFLLIILAPRLSSEGVFLRFEASETVEYRSLNDSDFNPDNFMGLSSLLFSPAISQTTEISLLCNSIFYSDTEYQFLFSDEDYDYSFTVYTMGIRFPVFQYVVVELGKLNHKIGSAVETEVILPFYQYTNDVDIGLWQVAVTSYFDVMHVSLFFAPNYDLSSNDQFDNAENEPLFGGIFTLFLFGIDLKTLAMIELIDSNTIGQYYAGSISYSPGLLPELIGYSDVVISNQSAKYQICRNEVSGNDIYSVKEDSSSYDKFYPVWLLGVSYLFPYDYEVRLEYVFNNLGFDRTQQNLLYDGINEQNPDNALFIYEAADYYRRFIFSRHYLLIGLSKLDILKDTDLLLSTKTNLQDGSSFLYLSISIKPSDQLQFETEVSFPIGFAHDTEYRQFLYDTMLLFSLSYIFSTAS